MKYPAYAYSDTPLHALTAPSAVSPADRLGVTIFFSVVTHLIVILGVTFTPEDPPERRMASLDVVLVPWHSETTPDRPDYLAQANQDGGGESAEKARPSAPRLAPFSAGEPALAALAPRARAADPRLMEPAMPSESTPSSAPMPSEASPAPAPSGAEAPPVDAARPLAQLRWEHEAIRLRPAAGRSVHSESGRAVEAAHATDSTPALDVDEATSRNLAMAALSAEIERKLQAYAERPRRKWISARTREHKFAAYMDAWRRRIERIGNLNYPDEALRRGLSGTLLLDVALNSDGTVEDITLRRSSGEPVLDDAAARIVELAAPFPEFPQSIAEEVDILHIERTWVFHPDATASRAGEQTVRFRQVRSRSALP